MRKILSLVLLSWSALAWSSSIPETVTSTALSVNSVNTADNAPFAVGADNKLHRFRSDNTGALVLGSGSSTGISGTVTVTISGTAKVLPLYLTFTPSTISQVKYSSITFTAVTADVNGVTIIAAVAGSGIAVISYQCSMNNGGRITLHHQGGAAVRSNSSTGNIIGGGLFGNDGGEVGSGAVLKPALASGQPVCADFDVSGVNTVVEVAITYITYN
jgi:hypothetical protein